MVWAEMLTGWVFHQYFLTHFTLFFPTGLVIYIYYCWELRVKDEIGDR
jgi:hypothetical protein